MKKQSQNDQLEDWRVRGVRGEFYLHRKLPYTLIDGDFTMAQVVTDEIEDRRQTVESHHRVGAAMRQISLAPHHARVGIGNAVVPIVVHRFQDIGKYSATCLP